MATANIDNMSDLYACLPLPKESTCIRLLDVYGPSGPEDSHSPIRCNLRIINLESERNPSFAALSYVWGIEATEGHFIECRGCPLRVTPNCHSALRHLRQKLGNFTIWIDAICINQKDESEKMNQISLMGDLYTKARITYVWLGEGNAATNRAMAYLETTGYLRYFFLDKEALTDGMPKPRHWAAVWCALRACVKLKIRLFSPSNNDLDRMLPNVGCLNRGKFSRVENASYQDMDDLLSRDWIKRIWTYQEILLASNPVVVCGDIHVPWVRLSLGITFLKYSGINNGEGIPIIATLNAWAQIASSRDRLHNARFTSIQSRKQQDLPSTTLQRYRKFITDVSRSITWLHFFNEMFMILALLILLVIAGIWAGERATRGTSAIQSTIPSSVISAANKASSSAAVCAVACVASDLAECSRACKEASTAASNAASLSAHFTEQVSYQTLDRTYGRIFGIVTCVFLTGFILFLNFKQRKHPRLQYVPLAQSQEIDLVDGICNRKSKEKKDKAIAVQAILQRLSKKELSPIDNANPLEHLYKQLCINLLEVTGSLQFLLPASLDRFTEHPSWVPNWAAEFDPFWLNPTLFKNTLLTATPGSTVHWKYNPRKDNLLTVRGRQICTIARCFELQKTLNTYDSSERDLHRSNLRSTLKCRPMFGRRDQTVSSVLKRIDVFDLPQPIGGSQIRSWKQFMRSVQRQDPEKILSHLESRDRLKSILHTQISICNYLASKGGVIFVTNHLHIEEPPLERCLQEHLLGKETDGDSDWLPRRIGIGSHNVRAGDSIVLIAGVSTPLVIRRDSTSTRIISPAIVQGIMEGETWDSSWRAEDLEEFVLS